MTVAALVPVRLETRFLAPGVDAATPEAPPGNGPDTWRLRLRIVPDTISIDRHDPAVSPPERLALASFWRAMATDPDPGDPASSARAAAAEDGWPDALSRLAASVGAGRAAWLVRSVPARRTENGVEVGDPAPGTTPRGGASVVGAFPAAVDVWAVWRDAAGVLGPPEVLTTLHPDRTALETATAGVPPWLEEWAQAEASGMAVEVTLPREPDALAVLGVSGLVDESRADALPALVAAHAAAGTLSLSGPGEATSIVHGAPVLPTGRDAADWFAWPPDPASPLVVRTLDALLGAEAAAALGPVRTSGDDTMDADLVRLAFPALWGYALGGALGLVEPRRLSEVWRWAGEWFRPQGVYATVVVDGTAYGVLPVVDAARLAAAGAGPAVSPVAPLLETLGRAVTAWARAAEADPGAGGGGVRDVVRTLRRGPVTGDFASARLQPVDLVAAVAGVPVEDERLRWEEQNLLSLDVINALDWRRYWGDGARAHRLPLPLIVPRPGPRDEDPRAAVEAEATELERWREDWLFEEVDLGLGSVRAIHAHREIATSSFHVDRRHPTTLLGRLYQRSMSVAGAVLDLVRQESGPGLDPVWGPEPAPHLLERLLLRGDSTQARHHLNALAHVLRDTGDGTWAALIDRTLVEELMWLALAGFELPLDLPRRCLDDAALNRAAHRAFRAVLETAASRWDPWWDAVGAAHVRDVQEASPGPPVAGVYGWVDDPWRGRPGPGPGGLLLAPSLAQAATAAALRDRAVHDRDGRWRMQWDSATIGPARALLADIADGWHPAEAVGRLVERRVVEEAAGLGVTVGSDDLVPLRERYPLRTGQGHFGCCHGLRVLADGAAGLEIGPPGALPAAIAVVEQVVACAADLLLAEAVHGVLAGRPERAAVATELLAGQLPPGPLDVLDADHRGRAVHTLVLGALPRTDPPAGSTGAVAAAASFDAAVALVSGAPWAVTLPGAAGPVTVPLAALGLRPIHAALLDDDALARLAALWSASRGTPVEVGGATPPAGAAAARTLLGAFAGRAPDPAELSPPGSASPDGAEPPGVVAARSAAVDGWRARIDRLAEDAHALAARLDEHVGAARLAWGVDLERERAERDGEEPPQDVPSGPSREELAADVLALAAWGVSPDADVVDLFSSERERGDVGLAGTLALLERGARALSARAAGARARGASAAALGELGAGRPLPVGTPAPLTLLGEELQPADATPTLTAWLPTVAAVCPAVAALPGVLALPGVSCAAVDAADPWRLGPLGVATPTPGALPPPDPRLTVVVGSDAADAEFVVIDAFAEQVPDAEPDLGVAFDAATPSAAPPQAILLVPSVSTDDAVTAGELPDAVLLARALARARMAGTDTLRDAGLGPLAASCLLPQDGDTGCPLDDPTTLPRFDHPAALVPLATHEDTADVVGATTADAAWMLGLQWRLGEHAGEDAASPLQVDLETDSSPVGEPLLRVRPAEAVAEDVGWRADELFHTARWPDQPVAGVEPGAAIVDRHDAGPLDWWALRRDSPLPPGGVRGAQTHVPGRLRWPGQPRRRYWQVDDAALDPVGRGPDRAHPATLHLVDVVPRLGDDWYRVPVAARAGDFLRLASATFTDAAGGRWSLRADPGWSLFAVAGADAPDSLGHALPALIGGGAALEGQPTEEVALAVDEDENLLWAAVLRRDGTVPGAAPGSVPSLVEVRPRLGALGDAPLEVDWRLGGTPPADRIPYLYGNLVAAGAFGHGEDVFVQARMRDPQSGELVDLPLVAAFVSGEAVVPTEGPHVLRPLAVPASGVRVARRTVLARDTAGNPVVWQRTERRPLDVAVDVDMPWDVLTARPPE